MFLFTTHTTTAQLYSSGNNTISGNKVGVGTNSPTSTLTVEPSHCNVFDEPLSPFLVNFCNSSYGNPPGGPQYAFKIPALYIAGNGNIGIHTNTPQEKFHVNTTSLFSENSSFSRNVGIGTNAPTRPLDVRGDAAVQKLVLRTPSSGSWFNIDAPNGQNKLNFNVGTTTNAKMTILTSGNVGVNNTNPQAKLHVNGDAILEGSLTIKGNVNNTPGDNEIKLNANTGQIRAREVKVDLTTIPDYVFKEDYPLMPLAEVKTFIQENGHLPNVKSEAQFKEEGSISLTEMNMKLLEKVEELTLYILQQEERISKLERK